MRGPTLANSSASLSLMSNSFQSASSPGLNTSTRRVSGSIRAYPQRWQTPIGSEFRTPVVGLRPGRESLDDEDGLGDHLLVEPELLVTADENIRVDNSVIADPHLHASSENLARQSIEVAAQMPREVGNDAAVATTTADIGKHLAAINSLRPAWFAFRAMNSDSDSLRIATPIICSLWSSLYLPFCGPCNREVQSQKVKRKSPCRTLQGLGFFGSSTWARTRDLRINRTQTLSFMQLY